MKNLKSLKLIVSIAFAIMLFFSGNVQAENAQLYDTMIPEPSGTYPHTYITFDNQANWNLVPYGTTDYAFSGNPILTDGHYYLYLHTSNVDDPLIYFPGRAIELYQISTRTYEWNLETISWEILENTPERIRIRHIAYDRFTRDANPDPGITTNLIYTVRKDAGFIEVTSGDGDSYSHFPHARVSRFGMGVDIDNIENDIVADTVYEDIVHPNQYYIYYNPPSNYEMVGQLVHSTLKYTLWSFATDYSYSRIKVNTAGDRSSIESTGYPEVRGSYFIAPITIQQSFHSEDPNQIVSAGQNFPLSYTVPVPGLYKVSAKIGDTWYTQVLPDTNLVFTTPVAGTLKTVIAYLYDRTANTPADKITPMDTYRMAMNLPSTPPPIPPVTQPSAPWTEPIWPVHACGDRDYPENTMVALIASAGLGAKHAEIDLHVTKDDVVILMHDETLDRTTDCSGLVNEHAWAQIQGCNAGPSGEVVPSFAEVLQYASTHDMKLLLHVKEPAVGPLIYDLIAARGMLDNVKVYWAAMDTETRNAHDSRVGIFYGSLIHPWGYYPIGSSSTPTCDQLIHEALADDTKAGALVRSHNCVLAALPTTTPATESFTIIVLPDTQFYSHRSPDMFTSQTQWIVDNEDELNIVFVTHVGDIVYDYGESGEWVNARAAMSILENAKIPHGMCPGNHDGAMGSTWGNTKN